MVSKLKFGVGLVLLLASLYEAGKNTDSLLDTCEKLKGKMQSHQRLSLRVDKTDSIGNMLYCGAGSLLGFYLIGSSFKGNSEDEDKDDGGYIPSKKYVMRKDEPNKRCFPSIEDFSRRE